MIGVICLRSFPNKLIRKNHFDTGIFKTYVHSACAGEERYCFEFIHTGRLLLLYEYEKPMNFLPN